MMVLRLLKNFLLQHQKKRAIKAFLKSRKEILSGIKNYYIHNKDVETIARYRYKICEGCDKFSNEDISCVIENSTPCCSICGCSIKIKVYSLSSSCPIHKWDNIISQEQELIYLSKLN